MDQERILYYDIAVIINEYVQLHEELSESPYNFLDKTEGEKFHKDPRNKVRNVKCCKLLLLRQYLKNGGGYCKKIFYSRWKKVISDGKKNISQGMILVGKNLRSSSRQLNHRGTNINYYFEKGSNKSVIDYIINYNETYCYSILLRGGRVVKSFVTHVNSNRKKLSRRNSL